MSFSMSSTMSNVVENKRRATNNRDNDHDSGFEGGISEEEALILLKQKRTKAQRCYRKANLAIIPDFIPLEDRKDTDCVLKETHVFTPNHGLSTQLMWNFIYLAADYGFNMEQSLAILHANKYDVKKSRSDLEIYIPRPSEWRYEKTTFLNALKEEEKYFYEIKHRFFPHRKVTDMVGYYYIWKMERKKRQLRDQLKKKQQMLKVKMNFKKVGTDL